MSDLEYQIHGEYVFTAKHSPSFELQLAFMWQKVWCWYSPGENWLIIANEELNYVGDAMHN